MCMDTYSVKRDINKRKKNLLGIKLNTVKHFVMNNTIQCVMKAYYR